MTEKKITFIYFLHEPKIEKRIYNSFLWLQLANRKRISF